MWRRREVILMPMNDDLFSADPDEVLEVAQAVVERILQKTELPVSGSKAPDVDVEPPQGDGPTLLWTAQTHDVEDPFFSTLFLRLQTNATSPVEERPDSVRLVLSAEIIHYEDEEKLSAVHRRVRYRWPLPGSEPALLERPLDGGTQLPDRPCIALLGRQATAQRERITLELCSGPVRAEGLGWRAAVDEGVAQLTALAPVFERSLRAVLEIIDEPSKLDAALLTFGGDDIAALGGPAGDRAAWEAAMLVATRLLEALRESVGGTFAVANLTVSPTRQAGSRSKRQWEIANPYVDLHEGRLLAQVERHEATVRVRLLFELACRKGQRARDILRAHASVFPPLETFWLERGGAIEMNKGAHGRATAAKSLRLWWTLAEVAPGEGFALDPEEIRAIGRALRPLANITARRAIARRRATYLRLQTALADAEAEGDASAATGTGILVNRALFENLIAAVLTRPFVLLAGISGTGKTVVAEWIGKVRVAGLLPPDVAAPVALAALIEERLISELSGEWLLLAQLPDTLLLPVVDDDDEADTTQTDDEIGGDEEAGEEDGTGEDDEAGEEDDGPDSLPFATVAVHADWQEAGQLWGYYQPLGDSPCFQASPALEVFLSAHDQGHRQAVLVLDEMNLSRIEHYGSDLLSAMERPGDKEAIELHRAGNDIETANGVEVPQRIGWPYGLVVIGTVNVDETTFAFAPKVLDRAAVIDFDDVDLSRYFEVQGRADEWAVLGPWFDAVQRALRPSSLHLGYRAALEVSRRVVVHLGIDPVAWEVDSLNRVLDEQLRNKVLPRIRGPRGQVRGCLLGILALAEAGASECEERLEILMATPAGAVQGPYPEAVYPRARQKVLAMLVRLYDTGFTGFF